MTLNLNDDITKAEAVLASGGIILYPTDTIWGLGCDATNSQAVKRIIHLKKRNDAKAFVVLVAEEAAITQYVTNPPNLSALIQYLHKPVTLIYDKGKNLAPEVIAADGSIAIRVVNENFCKTLINKFGKPVVSTSANVSGMLSTGLFKDINAIIKKGVDYIVQHRRNDITPAKPSSIIKFKNDGTVEVIRE
jgi:L-threonylcarbamoyladenylate synthase